MRRNLAFFGFLLLSFAGLLLAIAGVPSDTSAQDSWTATRGSSHNSV